MKLEMLPGEYSVCQLDQADPIPSWASNFLSVSRTDAELSIILPTLGVPQGIKVQHGFVCFRVAEALEFDVIGVIAKISSALANANVSLLSISTYNTDYFLVPMTARELAVATLIQDGYEFD